MKTVFAIGGDGHDTRVRAQFGPGRARGIDHCLATRIRPDVVAVTGHREQRARRDEGRDVVAIAFLIDLAYAIVDPRLHGGRR